MTYELLEWRPHPHNYYRCRDENGKEINMDIHCTGSIPTDIPKKDLVGRRVHVSASHCFLRLADECQLLEESKTDYEEKAIDAVVTNKQFLADLAPIPEPYRCTEKIRLPEEPEE